MKEHSIKKIGVFGGTFNPPHFGHLKLADAVAKREGFDKMIIIPTHTPPHKVSRDLASSQDRLAMCRLTFTDPLFEVSDMEIQRGGKSYTYETLLALQEQYPGAAFFLLVGSDMFLTFHEWRNVEKIFDLCTVYAAARDDSKNLQDLASYAEQYFPRQADKIQILRRDFDPIDISSTQLREKFSRGEEVGDFVPSAVKEYIISRGLYSGPKSFSG